MTTEDKQTTDPGRTPGQAEGVPKGHDQSEREPEQTSRTQDQAEGNEQTTGATPAQQNSS